MRFKKVYIEITNNCNLNCDFCIKNSRPVKFMQLDDLSLILNKIKPYTDYLYFHLLGEPLMHPKINEFIDYATKEHFKVNITTNGYLIDRIKDNHSIRQLNISLHSFDPKYKIKLDDYINNILDISNILSKRGTFISFRFWVNNKYSLEMLEKINNYFKTNIKLQDISNNIMVKENIFINSFHLFKWPDLNDNNIQETGKCYGLIDHIGILSDGVIVPCCLDTKGDINLGNIYKDNIDEILKSDRVNNIINGFKNNKKCEELCKKCNFYNKIYKFINNRRL